LNKDHSKISPLKQALIALEKMQQKINRLESKENEPIAIIGLGCRFPNADNPAEFWRMLVKGENAIEEIPEDRWNVDHFFSTDYNQPGKMVTRWGGFLKDIDKFDPQFFGISPREAKRMDPQQRILMEVVWQSFENAGIIPFDVEGSNTGVFIGIGNTDYSQYTYGNYHNNSGYTGTGNATCISANRLSYFFDFNGPSLAIDTACSSSLVAVHLASKSLLTGECSMAIAGGVNLILSPDVHLSFSKAQMLAPDGRCKTFDSKADGYVRSEGCGVILLKRLSDAERDGDTILARIRGSAVNQDGKSNGITAPVKNAQIDVISAALDDAKITPSEISYIESHGTGTKLGDPIETQALSEVFNDRELSDKILLGAVKTNIGHTESAAGIAGLIKVVLAMKNKVVPQNINFEKLNPLISTDFLPFILPDENIEWKDNKKNLMAGVSSFGFGGTNSHIVLEDYAENPVDKIKNEDVLKLFNVSAKSEDVLDTYVNNHQSFIRDYENINVHDYCFTSNSYRAQFDFRTSFVISDYEDFLNQLQNYEKSQIENEGLFSSDQNIAFLFTGQGSQYPKMGKLLYDTQPVFRREFDKCNKLFDGYLEFSLLDIIYNESFDKKINNTAYTQPALFSFEYSLAKLLQYWGIEFFT